MNIKLINKAELFQGRNKTKNYFEGWYFKNVSVDQKKVISIIPGVSIDTYDKHAFIQTIINNTNCNSSKIETHYHRFSIDDFSYYDNPFGIVIEKNKFSCNGIELDLVDSDYSLNGKLSFSELTKIKTSVVQPNTMGFFAYFPFMECYHEILSMNHTLNGSINLNEEVISFEHGKGYIEKDWGVSFPKDYIWIQSNNFENPTVSIMCSIANIPFIGTAFKGFICNLVINNTEYRFASYNLSKIKLVEYNDTNVKVLIEKDDLLLDIDAKMANGGNLKAPKNGVMKHIIKEGLNGIVSIKLMKKSEEVIFSGTGNCCGIEVVESLELN